MLENALALIFRANAVHRERRMRAWREQLAEAYRDGTGPAVYVTHLATIRELSGRSLGSGAMLVVEIDAAARPVDP